MIMYDQAFLMNPATNGFGLSGLGCGSGCSCDSCSSLDSLSGLDGFLPLSCSYLGIACPTTDQIINDPRYSDYGKLLTPENRLRAEHLASGIVDSDNPCNYSEINNMSEVDKLLKCGQVNWWILGGAVLGGAIILKKI